MAPTTAPTIAPVFDPLPLGRMPAPRLKGLLALHQEQRATSSQPANGSQPEGDRLHGHLLLTQVQQHQAQQRRHRRRGGAGSSLCRGSRQAAEVRKSEVYALRGEAHRMPFPMSAPGPSLAPGWSCTSTFVAGDGTLGFEAVDGGAGALGSNATV